MCLGEVLEMCVCCLWCVYVKYFVRLKSSSTLLSFVRYSSIYAEIVLYWVEMLNLLNLLMFVLYWVYFLWFYVFEFFCLFVCWLFGSRLSISFLILRWFSSFRVCCLLLCVLCFCWYLLCIVFFVVC